MILTTYNDGGFQESPGYIEINGFIERVIGLMNTGVWKEFGIRNLHVASLLWQHESIAFYTMSNIYVCT